MAKARAAGAVVVVLGSVAMVLLGLAPVSEAQQADPPGLWTVGPYPADLSSTEFPYGIVYVSEDAFARDLADLEAEPGPVGPDGCVDVAVTGSRPQVPLPEMASLDAVFERAELCRHGSSALTRLVLTGYTVDAGDGSTVGKITAAFARASESDPFRRSDLAYTGDGACYQLGSRSGFPGDLDDVDDYVVQGWNRAGDPSVDCTRRTVPVTTSTTTTATSSVTPTTSVTPTGAGAPPASAATPVQGRATFTG